MLRGQVKHQLDGKYRLRLPAKMREEIGKFVLVRGINGCLFAFNEKVFNDRYGEKLMNIPTYNVKYQRAKASITGIYDEPKEDGQGRFVLQTALREFAGITKNILIVGAVDHIQIWDEERHDQFMKGKLELSEDCLDFNACMAELEEFNI